jgi:hypothetical protein
MGWVAGIIKTKFLTLAKIVEPSVLRWSSVEILTGPSAFRTLNTSFLWKKKIVFSVQGLLHGRLMRID